MAWTKYRLKDIAVSIQTGPFGSQLHQSDYSEVGTPVVMPKDMIDGTIEESNIARVSEAHVNRLSRHKVMPGDILYSRRGDVGRCAIITEREAGWLCGTGCLKVQLDRSKVVPTFVFYILKRKDSVGWIENHAVGATMPNLNTEILKKLPITLPPLLEQRRIASILSAYDNLIENNTRRIRLLEQMAENIYKEWFVRFRFPGHENAEFENGLPKGWQTVKLSEYADIVMGQSPDSQYYNESKIGLPFHQGVGSYGYFYLNDDVYSSQGKKIAEPNSIIFSVRAPVGRINITLHRIIIGRGVCSINAKDGTNAFLLWLLKDKFSKEDSIGNGAIFASVTKDELSKQKILIPDNELLLKFNRIADHLEKQIRLLTSQNHLLTRQRDLLLPRLMSGKLEVKS